VSSADAWTRLLFLPILLGGGLPVVFVWNIHLQALVGAPANARITTKMLRDRNNIGF